MSGSREGRTDEAIRADIAITHESANYTERYHDAIVRLLRDIEPLLADRDRLREENERLRATINECADDFAALPNSNWTGRMVADTFRAALAAALSGPVAEEKP